MGKMIRLYTRQNDKTLRQLERDGRIINHRAYVEMHFGDIAPLFRSSEDASKAGRCACTDLVFHQQR